MYWPTEQVHQGHIFYALVFAFNATFCSVSMFPFPAHGLISMPVSCCLMPLYFQCRLHSTSYCWCCFVLWIGLRCLCISYRQYWGYLKIPEGCDDVTAMCLWNKVFPLNYFCSCFKFGAAQGQRGKLTMSMLCSIRLSNAINSYCGPSLKSISHAYGVTINFYIRTDYYCTIFQWAIGK